MQLNICDEALIQTIRPSAVAAESAVFLRLPLHTITVEELTFTKPFKVTLTKDIDALDGWAVWFDIFFTASCNSIVSGDAVPSHRKKQDFVAFTTGPDGPETHWQQGIFLIQRGKKIGVPLKKGQIIEGHVGYRKKDSKSRLLDIEIQWDVPDVEQGLQEWSL
jgi:protein arginine N-methyltransferase 3